MVIERANDEIIFRLPADIDTNGLERIVNYLKYKEAIRKSQQTNWQTNPKNAGEPKIKQGLSNKTPLVQLSSP